MTEDTRESGEGARGRRKRTTLHEFRAIGALLVLGLGLWVFQSAVNYSATHEDISLMPIIDHIWSREVIISLVGIVCFLGYGIYVSRMVIEIRRVEEERERLISDLTRAKEALYHQATHDGLSGLWNRATILERLGQELNRSRRNGALISVVIADVDYFKRVNDAYGHLAGDEVLRQISDLIAHSIRSHDLAGRYGGEEFIMVLPGCDKENARLVCERLREELNNNPIKTPEGVFRITMSFGVATGSATELDLDALVRAADRALYRAKKRGRNRVELGIEEDFLHGEV